MRVDDNPTQTTNELTAFVAQIVKRISRQVMKKMHNHNSRNHLSLHTIVMAPHSSLLVITSPWRP